MKMSLFLNFEELGVKELKVYNVNNKLILKIIKNKRNSIRSQNRNKLLIICGFS